MHPAGPMLASQLNVDSTVTIPEIFSEPLASPAYSYAYVCGLL